MCETALFFYLSLWRVFHRKPAPCGIHGPLFFSGFVLYMCGGSMYAFFFLSWQERKKFTLCQYLMTMWKLSPHCAANVRPFPPGSLWIMKYTKVWDITKRAAQARLSGCQEKKMWGESLVQEWRAVDRTEKGLKESKIHKLWNPVSIQIHHISEPDL